MNYELTFNVERSSIHNSQMTIDNFFNQLRIILSTEFRREFRHVFARRCARAGLPEEDTRNVSIDKWQLTIDN